ncbi:MAG: cytidylate kinase [Legionellales bacterium]|nr:cytidylate kinase [Legionellales bacterium]|tara:strand:- start:227 stop:928 length:702 start_codon:yes stop_codon:yes gene_type:complete
MSDVNIITIDGPSGTGKGTVCIYLTKLLNWHFLDSGALYRVLAYAAETLGVNYENEVELVKLVKRLNIEFKLLNPESVVDVFLDGKNVTNKIRTETCGKAASLIAPKASIRKALLVLQRGFLKKPGLIADGRDMGTVVFPGAQLKIYLTASIEVRAKRRFKQLKDAGFSVNLRRLHAEIAERDERDSTRNISPLKPAKDAFIIDTSLLDIKAVEEEIKKLVFSRFTNLQNKGG